MTLDSDNIKFMRIFAVVPWRRGVKQQWGNGNGNGNGLKFRPIGRNFKPLRILLLTGVMTSSVFARDSIYAKRAYAIAIPSVCLSVRLSVRHTGGSVKNG